MIGGNRGALPECSRVGREERAKRFLEEYRICVAMLRSVREAGKSEEWEEQDGGWNERAEVSLWRAKCRAVSALIGAMEPSREKMLLSLRYIKGIPMERIAELMNLSRRTVYRVHRNALLLTARELRL